MYLQKTAFFLLLISAGIAHATGAHWTYKGEKGPQVWGQLSPEYALCATERNQSPINIEGALQTHHRPLAVSHTQAGQEIFNNGHTVQINFKPGNTLKLEDGTYEMKQVHFHAPSENQIAGKSYPLEAHFVHADDKGNLAVIGVMFKDGKENPALQKLWAQMPEAEGAPVALAGIVNPSQLMPKNKAYYRFAGSLTTPPCSEGVRWLVLKQPVSASREQIDAFAKVMHHQNNRTVQPVNGRVIVQ